MTLIEIIIVIVIMGVFVRVLFGTYQRMSDISVKVERDQILTTQSLAVNQILQNMTEEYTMYYSGYVDADISLQAQDGWTDVLYLTGAGEMVTVSFVGECGHDSIPDEDLPQYVLTHTCWMQMEYEDGRVVDLLDPQQIYVHG